MKSTSAVWALLGVGAALSLAQGCRGSEVPIAYEDGGLDSSAADSGNGECGAVTCNTGELCCAGTDEFCSPTCMQVTVCPVLGRPCKVDGGHDAATALTWHATCGDPICQAPDANAPPPPVCQPQGTPCTTKGETCGDGISNCGSIMVCDDHDPKIGGCPVSSAKFKDGIHYLSDGELSALHDETLSMQLASYTYKGPWANGSNATHLGFIIEDQPQSLSVERGHDRVDIYGYLSMIVATMQVQDRELQQLRKELDATRAACAKE